MTTRWARFGIYGAVVGICTAIEHVTVGRWLRRSELVRIGVGVVTVMFPAVPLAADSSMRPADVWLLLAGGFVMAGSVRLGLEAIEDEIRRPRIEAAHERIRTAAAR